VPGAVGWWRDSVLYHVYVRSFADADGDGVGDLRGVLSRLDHLEWLGVDALWLSPTGRSPNDDYGYDVCSYDEVDPELGTNADLEELIREAGTRGIGIVLDLVPNHTSDRHPWFVDAVSSRESAHRDWYVWADPAPGGGPPSNWKSIFGGDAWELDEASGQYLLHNFLESMPDLNWWNEDVRAEFERILRSWFDLGVLGVRIDVAHALIHDRELRDNPVARPEDGETAMRLGQFMAHNMNRPEVLDIYRRWHDLAAGYEPQRLLLGETYVVDLERLADFYDGDGLHLGMNFAFVHAELDELPTVVDETFAALPDDAWPVWVASSHDHVRFPTRWANGDEARARLALVALLTQRGTPILYQGDELVMEQVEVPFERVLDPVGRRFWPEQKGRDGSRTPIPWEPGPGHGFTRPDVEPWLPFGEHEGRTVADQRDDPGSALHLARDLLALRRREADLREGAYERLEAPAGIWAYRRGDAIGVVLNLGDEPAAAPLAGTTLLATDRHGEGVPFDGDLAPGRGLVLSLDG
jgi:alpha-glucosidase